MKRGVIVGVTTFQVIFSLFLVSLIPHFVSADDEPGVWDSGFTVELADEDRQFKNGHPCEVKKIYSTARTTLKGKHYYSYPERDSYCGLYTDYGFTDEFYYAFTGGQDKVHDLDGPINYFRHFPNHITTMSVAAPWNTSQRIISYYDYDFYKDVPDSYIKTGSSQPTLRKNLGTAMNSNDPFLMQYADNQVVKMLHFGVSENGRYIAFVENEKKAIVMHDTINKTYTTVARDTMNTGSSGSIAVANDGSAVLINGTGVSSVTNSSGKLAMKLYKTAGCTQTLDAQDFVSTVNFDATGCVMIELTDYLKDVLGDNPGYTGADTAYFHPRNYYVQAAFIVQRDKDGNPTSGRKYVQFTPNNAPQERGYLAMGDSFSSGEGDGQGGEWYEPGTDEHGDEGTFLGRNLCHVSRRSYPYLLAKRLGYLQGSEQTPITPSSDGDFHSVACSGAVMHNVVGGSIYGEDQGAGDASDFKYRDNQYRYDRQQALSIWQQGATRQINSINSAIFAESEVRDFSPEVITLGIGGNDAGFSTKVQACALPGTCPYAKEGSDDAGVVALELADLKFRLVDSYQKVKRSAPENTRIYVHGYPVFVDASGTHPCNSNTPFNHDEVVFISEAIKYMNTVVESAAKEAGVFYVNVSEALSGNELCSGTTESDSTFNGVTAGDDMSHWILDLFTVCGVRNGCLGSESFHPTPKGHEKYALAIQSQTNNFTVPVPDPEINTTPLPDNFFGDKAAYRIAQMNAARIQRQPLDFPLSYSDRVELQPVDLESQITIQAEGFEALSSVIVEVHSDPIVLGSYTVDEEGTLQENITLPEGLEPGVHEVHVFGTDPYGQQIDLYSSFFVSFSENDRDGDGVNNDTDGCPLITNTGVDVDEDGVDDACDGRTTLLAYENEELPPEEQEPELDKGLPSPETVAGTIDEPPLGGLNGQVLGTITESDSSNELSQTGQAAFVSIVAGAIVIISGIIVRKKPKVYHAKK